MPGKNRPVFKLGLRGTIKILSGRAPQEYSGGRSRGGQANEDGGRRGKDILVGARKRQLQGKKILQRGDTIAPLMGGGETFWRNHPEKKGGHHWDSGKTDPKREVGSPVPS